MLRVAAAFLTMSLAVASAKSYTVNVFQTAMIGGTEVKAGEYKLEVDGEKVVLTKGAKQVEAAVSVQSTESKNDATIVRLETRNGKVHIKEIWIAGTNTKLIVQ